MLFLLNLLEREQKFRSFGGITRIFHAIWIIRVAKVSICTLRADGHESDSRSHGYSILAVAHDFARAMELNAWKLPT